MEVFTGLFALALIGLRIAVPIYLYQQAKRRSYPTPWVWIIFGIFEPIVALIAYYLLSYLDRRPI